MAEVHITSVVAFVRPGTTSGTAALITEQGLAEVARIDPRGRLVLLIERPSTGAVLDSIDAVRALRGVLAVHLAYQHAEDSSVLEENA